MQRINVNQIFENDPSKEKKTKRKFKWETISK